MGNPIRQCEKKKKKNHILRTGKVKKKKKTGFVCFLLILFRKSQFDIFTNSYIRQ